ncbi:MAG: PEPxxWA-CTERM sorting domain-containing protein [Pseudomonadota bacterium]|uniref:PEPxxWA-CTERM sorting domain-containing protein n=1 Tax=Phenylobacterium sp. TaxID=1871053 RepID=UPI0025E9C529|nr:PEPxxWA-CTERM sorting domain-containing protein [Phenylobacterium sp.]
MKKITTALAGAILTAALAATPASAAQIILNSSMIIGNTNSAGANGANVVNQQTGAVATGLGTYKPGFTGLLTFDLGQAYDLGRIDLFTSGLAGFSFLAGNTVGYNGWGSWHLNGQTNTATTGTLSADGGQALTAQSFQISGAEKYRYIQLYLSPLTPAGIATLDEFRVFDREVIPSAVPEPATWAMMIMGFGLAGSAIRRRSAVFRAA